MTFAFIIWLVTVFIPSLSVLTTILLMAFIGMLAFLVIYGVLEEEWDGFKKLISYKKSIFLLVFLACALPGKKETWYILSAYGVEKLVENPSAQALAEDGVDVLKELLARAKRELVVDIDNKVKEK